MAASKSGWTAAGWSTSPTGWDSAIYDRTIKFGIYAYDDSNFSNNETRTLYYDNISVVVTNKNSGLNTVDPG